MINTNFKFYAITISISVAISTLALASNAGPSTPVPIYGNYDAYLDHTKQTFNGKPNTSKPSTQAASFTTTCAASGCVAHWLRVTELTENPNAPSLFDYNWVNDRWESKGDYPFHCDDGSLITTSRFDFIKPNNDGTFSGERTFTVIGSGCPGEGPGKYWLPFTLTPKNSTPKTGTSMSLQID